VFDGAYRFQEETTELGNGINPVRGLNPALEDGFAPSTNPAAS